jgi:hypothetical protein
MSTKKRRYPQLYVSLRVKDPEQKRLLASINRSIIERDKDASAILFDAVCAHYKIKLPARKPLAVARGGAQITMRLFDVPLDRRIRERFEAELKRTGLAHSDLLRKILSEQL